MSPKRRHVYLYQVVYVHKIFTVPWPLSLSLQGMTACTCFAHLNSSDYVTAPLRSRYP